ncbi:MAG: DUF4912 domain-containing protein [Nitrospirae bacterium]|nr:DUF4912 domain-containing protein [Nitrospirota bacterium]
MKVRVKSKSKKTLKPSKKTEKIKDKKPAKKVAKKSVAKGKTKAKKPIKSKKEIEEQKKTASKKPAARKAEKEKKTAVRKKATEKAIEKEPKKIALPAKKIPRIPQRTLQKIEKSPTSLAIITAKKGLPAEYGEDRITLMTVDPWKLFAYWDVREDTLSKIKGTLVLRVYDVTGIYFDGKNANLVFDIPVFGRIGDNYIGVGPDKAFIVDIGAVSKGGDFVMIARSNQAATPALKVAKEEGALPQEIYEVGPVTGYF